MNELSNKNPSFYKFKNLNNLKVVKADDSNEDDPAGVSSILNINQIVWDFENNLL